MNTSRIDILFKAITLLHRECELEVTKDDSSRELARTIITTFNTNNKNNQLIGGESTIIDDLKYLIQDMVDNPDGYDTDSITQSIVVILKEKPALAETVNKSITTEMSVPGMKRSVLTLRNRLNNYYKEYELRNLISKASYSINTGNLGDDSLLEYAKTLATNIEALTFTTNKTKDPGIVNEFDINSEEDVGKLFSKVSGDNVAGSLLKVSWQDINDMLQGGFRKGSFVMVNALQHNYKSGFLRSILAQMLRCNIPVLKDPTKKPLMVYISFEDDAEISIEFFYKYLYYSEHGKLPNMIEITPTEAAAYVKVKLSVNGYNIKMLRVNPSDWTYKHIFNKLLQYEADGYEIHAVLADYLSKLPTTGCIQGPAGTDIRDMFNRVRNYMSARDILFITPHQISVAGKQLIRNGVSPLTFVKEVTGKGMTSDSTQLDQVVDLELYIHKAKVNGKYVLTVQRGKDRRPTIVDDNKLYCVLPFPNKAPIPDNVDDHNETSDTDGDDEFGAFDDIIS